MKQKNRRVVITGMGTLNPLGNNVAETWEKVVRGESGIAPITLFDASSYKTRIAGEVKNFDGDALFGRREARRMDRVTQLALAAAAQALADAHLVITPENCNQIGVVMGSGLGIMQPVIEGTHVLDERGPGRVSPFFVPMMLPDTPAGMISIVHGLRGPNMGLFTACASSNNALGEAARMVQRGAAEVMLAGGSEACILPLAVAGFSIAGALSERNDEPQAASRPFDKTRDGFVPAEGSAVLVLEALEYAQRRGARIYGEFVGYGSSADAYHISSPPEDGEGAVRSMRLALADAGLQRVDYLNAHGTSTPLNDKTETAALKTVFGEQIYDIPVSSTKSLHGHLLGATAALEAILSLKAMAAGLIPATSNYTTPDPDCDLDYVPNTPRPAQINTVMSNAFGFGGHNATIILQKWGDDQGTIEHKVIN